MYLVLARKYRPQTFEELIGQRHVRTTLANAIARKRLAHGYIFSGQRGTGKTTVARILARCLNCQNGPTAVPCGVCSSCLEVAASNSVDVIEIDAASNRGISEMRELRESVKYRPARDAYKVFIIDEAHQITSEAFNALLKTLEEPPEWVVFVLCTTEAHKIPTTVASRCQQFAFRSVEFSEIVDRLRWICERESIAADAEVLAVVAQSGEGSVRDALSALDQAIACCGSQLEPAEVRRLLGMFSLESLHQVTTALSQGDSRRMLDIVQELEATGGNLQHFCRELARYFRNLLVAKIAGPASRLIAASGHEQQRMAEIASPFSEEDLTRYLQLTLDLFRELQFSLQPRLHLEIGLLRLVHAGRLLSIEEAISLVESGGGPGPPTARPPSAPAPPVPSPAPSASPDAPAGIREKLAAAAARHGMTFVADALEHAEIAEQNGELQFKAPREFTLALRSQDMQRLVQESAGRPMKISVEVGEPPSSPAPDPAGQAGSEAFDRALAHPEVQRFQELFPDSQVRAIRNLKQ